jgi:hypothetical protein
LSATHPPLAKRILRIDPQWDGKFETSDPPEAAPDEQHAGAAETLTRQGVAKALAVVAAGAAVADVMTAIDQAGNPKPEAVLHARALLSELPTVIRDAAREPYGARAVIYSLALDEGQEVRLRQLKQLQDHADPDVYALTLTLMPQMGELDIKFRLPVIDIAIAALKQLSLSQYESFKKNLIALIEMDSRVDLLEWSLQKILFRHLDGQFLKLEPTNARYSDPGRFKRETEVVLSVMAHAGANDQRAVEDAFGAAAESLGSSGLVLLAKNKIEVSDLDVAFEKLDQLKPLAKSRLLRACVVSIGHDQTIAAAEVELLRAFAGVLDCPMPSGMA